MDKRCSQGVMVRIHYWDDGFAFSYGQEDDMDKNGGLE